MTTREAMLILLVLLPFGGSAVIGFFRSTAKNNEAWFAGVIALFSLLFTIMLYPAIYGNHVVRLDISWFSEWGVDLILRMDGLSWLFCLLITGIGLLIVVYARYYMDPADSVPRFFLFPRFYGLNDRNSLVRKSRLFGGFLGTHQYFFFFIDWVLVSQCKCA